MPLLFLLLIAFATGALSAYAGRDELRHSSDPVWRMETFLAYALFVTLVLVPTTIYFYAFHGDWFLFYWVDTARAPWFWGLMGAALLLGAALLGFWIGLALCRASRDLATRRITIGSVLMALAVWPLAWSRLSVVGSHRQFSRDYGLTTFFASPAFYSGLAMVLVIVLAFGWLVYHVDRHTRDSV
ncbi:MAG: hypothetical protein KJO40_04370 [Deltaproteobacteria bacterium]|nr:hypothetical protein [Deltaproteobacteria bacterium]NND29730.1 hypothetical protein [Myxococcales bacterium]MBT8466530.1 hypothetical protein [Deltaproteobacteria bacterium]MBT8481683.1 hypothetical protein [Deltaproteobacteria bacterium]NNK06009.1 hypothetical protein [Myxococcales bacterium]